MLPVQITTKDMPISAALETLIRKRVEKLNRYYDRIMNCHIVIEVPQKHKHQGKLYNVKIDTNVPGKVLMVNRKLDQDIYIAIRDAFDAMERQLEELGRKRHGRVKTHEDVLSGHIARIMTEEGYGFIDGNDGNEYYFSITNVSHPHFDQLAIGDAVEFIADNSGDGLKAHRVVRAKQNDG